MKIEVEEITSVDELHKSLKGDGRMEKAEPVHEVDHIEETAFSHPAGFDPREPVGPTDDMVGEQSRDWEGDQEIGHSSIGDDNTRGSASAVPRGSPDETTGVGPATGGVDGYGYPAVPDYQKQDSPLMRGVTVDELDEAVEKAGAGTRGGQITGYDKHGKPIYAGARKRSKEREEKSKKERTSSREEVKLRSLRREQTEKKEKAKVEEQGRGGKVVGHATGGRPVYELEGGKQYTKERASKYGKKSMNPHEDDLQLSDENLERAFKIGPVTIGGKKQKPADPQAASRRAASGALTPGALSTSKITSTTPGPQSKTASKPLPGAAPKKQYTIEEHKKRKEALTKKGIFVDELGGYSAFMKSMAILASSGGSIQGAEDLAWDTGIEDDEYQSLRTLMRSFPPRMWQFLKRVANKSIDTRTAIQHVAACIGEINKSLDEDTDMRKSLGDIGDPLGAEVIDPDFIPNIQEAMDNAMNQAEKDADHHRKSQCPTHAYAIGGSAGASNYNSVCHCHRVTVTKGQIARRAYEITQEDEDLSATMDWLGIDQSAMRIYTEAR